MLWSIDTYQNEVSADQYHVTISRAQVTLSRSTVFLKLTTDPGLVVDWIADSTQIRHSHLNEAQFSHSFCGSTQLHIDATLVKLLTVNAFRVQVRFGKYIFLAFFLLFSFFLVFYLNVSFHHFSR